MRFARHYFYALLYPVFYSPDKKPVVSENDPSFSVDVFIMDESGMHGLACWNYEKGDEHWIFHTETLVNYFEKDDKTIWKWYYPPYTQAQIMS